MADAGYRGQAYGKAKEQESARLINNGRTNSKLILESSIFLPKVVAIDSVAIRGIKQRIAALSCKNLKVTLRAWVGR